MKINSKDFINELMKKYYPVDYIGNTVNEKKNNIYILIDINIYLFFIKNLINLSSCINVKISY